MSKQFPSVLLKLSGESLGSHGDGITATVVKKLARELAIVNKKRIPLAIVLGGGNIWRFRDNKNLKSLPREKSDYLGMLATVYNGVVLGEYLRAQKCLVGVFSAVPAPGILAEKYSPTAAKKILVRGGIVLLTGGTGRPYVTTDTAAARRAVELDCARVLKATNVDGVYTADPRKVRSAKLLRQLTYAEVLAKRYQVMDDTAFALLAKKQTPLTVFNFSRRGLLLRAARGEHVGTLVH